MFRRRSRRSSFPRAVIQSYKKVLNYAPTSQSTSLIPKALSVGTDSVAAGQTSVTDTAVPTGAIIKFFEIQYTAVNLAAAHCVINVAIQLVHSGQPTMDPTVVGGSPRRNQIHFQALIGMGLQQNSNHVYRFKIPKKYQRVREGDVWQFITKANAVHSDAAQIIYKFYR